MNYSKIAAGAMPLLWIAVGLMVVGCQGVRPASAPSAPEVDDQVNIGYGTQSRREITSSVQSLTAEQMKNQRVGRAEELLEGRFAGVQVLRMANGSFSVRIRGTTSIMGRTEPLFVIDGMPVSYAPGTALQGINPNDIARIEVLKDAGATAIYGSRGANGVVLITTKRADSRRD